MTKEQKKLLIDCINELTKDEPKPSEEVSEIDQKALLAIRRRVVYDLKAKSYVYVNKLIYWADELMIIGYGNAHYKANDYGITWKENDK